MLLLGVAEEGERGRDPRETLSLARYGLNFRVLLPHPMFSKGPWKSLDFSQNDFEKLEKRFKKKIRCNLIEISPGFYI